MKKFIFFVALATISFTSIHAQDKWYTWESYKTKFKVPPSFVVTESDAAKFIAGNHNINLSIYPKTGAGMSYESMKANIKEWAHTNDLTFASEPVYIRDNNRYWGIGLDCTNDDGKATSLFLFINPDNPTISLYIWFQYNSGYMEKCLDILNSFTPIF